MGSNEFIENVPVIISLIAALIGAVVFIMSQDKNLRRDMIEQVANLETKIVGKIDLVSAVESKARHDLRGELARMLLACETSITRIDRESARKDEVLALENRVGTKVDKLENKIDRMNEQLQVISLVKQQTDQNGIDLQRVLARLEKKPATAD